MEELLKDSRFLKRLAQIAKTSQQDKSTILAEAKIYLQELYTEHDPLANIIGAQISQWILAKGYDKAIDVNHKEIKELAKLMRAHSVAFVMTHKTYIDMFVLATVLNHHGLPLPYTFAGKNMSFMGLREIGKKSGAIFIRRSFKDSEVYKETLCHFIKHLVDNQGHFMWAIEGTRSRTGKIVWPKMGILKYILEAEKISDKDVKYVPVSIVYDLIPDVSDMTKEGRGKKKKAESLSWFVDYVRKMKDLGRISIRFGQDIQIQGSKESGSSAGALPKFAFELVRGINQITPVTTTSLICTSLLSKYSLTKRAIESDVADLMSLVESHKPDALVDRGKPIGQSVQKALNLLIRTGIVQQQGQSLHAKHIVSYDQYLPATYYANMAVHHLYHLAFIELAVLNIQKDAPADREMAFWTEIMDLRDLFKFEFFYSNKSLFSDEITSNLYLFDSKWGQHIGNKTWNSTSILNNQKVLVAPVVLFIYIEAYQVMARAATDWPSDKIFTAKDFLDTCLFLGEEMHWQGKIQRIESVSRPFLQNAYRLFTHLRYSPDQLTKKSRLALTIFSAKLDDVADRIKALQKIILAKHDTEIIEVPVERDIVPGSTTEGIVQEILQSEEGPHIAALFDLDRTLIKDFSAKEFFQNRLLSGKMTRKEIIAQFSSVLVYGMGNRNFAGLAAVSAKGIKGIKEKVFIEVGEEVYLKHLADSIYPESRALVAAHMARGHTVAIVSAATPYQVNPIARDLAIDHIMCTRMEVKNGKFTGNVVEPPCWGAGKSMAANDFAKEQDIDLQKSYFYTDSIEDLPLLEIVGHPRAMNPDSKLSNLAFESDWPIYRFDAAEEKSSLINVVRTGMVMTSLIPAAVFGAAKGARSLSWRDGVNNMTAMIGDLGSALAGIKLVVKGQKYLWSHRPAVFMFNHQSNADLFIIAKLLRKDAMGIAKKELQHMPILGQLMTAAGVIFLDRSNREKAIEAMKPALDALKNGTSIAIAPEGTRSYTYNLGKFKKGGFHIAMQAKAPIVPIVIKNAHDVMPRGTNIFKPSHVEVVVLPPLKTDSWKRKDLDQHIEEVRSLFLTELGQGHLVTIKE